MTAIEVLHAVEQAGGSVVLNGEHIKYAIPKPAAWLVVELRQQRDKIVPLLQQRTALPPMPPGVRLVRWAPKQPPLVLQQCSVVIDVDKFISSTLAQLQARLEGRDFLAGNWGQRDLIERLEQVGVEVEVNDDQSCPSTFEDNAGEMRKPVTDGW
ncbi:MAG: hypothetical protein ABSE85_03725 [Candidatus Korobacteraceae bacterium]|jgi:hypothetical protein